MLIEVKEKWLHDGELCMRGTADGKPFSAVFINTEVDYGWHALNYLPAYQSEPDFTDDQEELPDYLSETVDSLALTIELLKT
jgi:hypothetical protein